MAKANIGVQTIFFILMSLFMVWIIVFGISQIFFVKDVLTESDRLEIQDQIKELVNYCNDPLNRGNKYKVEVKHEEINTVCFISDGIDLNTDLGTIYDGGDNVVLLDVTSGDYNDVLNSNYDIVDSFKIYHEFESSDTTCFDVSDEVFEVDCE